MSEDETTTEDNYESLATHLVSSQLINKPPDVSVVFIYVNKLEM